MSWAAHNPEAYEQCERVAVADLIAKELKSYGFDSFDWETVRTVAYVMQAEWPEVFQGLTYKADVGGAMSDYLTRGL